MWFEVIKLIVTIAQHKKETDQKQKERVSKMLLQMSELLVETAKELATGVYPQGKCATMWALSEDFLNYVQDKVNEEEFKLISELLHSCSQLEREYADRENPQTITDLFLASGQLHSLSILYGV